MRKKECTKNCVGCNTPFISKVWRNQKYCSHRCFLDKNKHISPNTEIKKGQRISPKTEFQKGFIPWNWKGDDVGYKCLHDWVKRNLGKPSKCEFCKTTVLRKYEWSNISGQYKRELNDWQRLCVPCHRKYDYERSNYEVQAI